MTGGSKRLIALSMAGLLGSLGAITAAQLGTVRAESPAPRPRRAIPTRRYYGIAFNYPNGPGWTVAQVKRLAKKARNRRRDKHAKKGASA